MGTTGQKVMCDLHDSEMVISQRSPCGYLCHSCSNNYLAVKDFAKIRAEFETKIRNAVAVLLK